MKVTAKTLQSVVMGWVINTKHHEFVIPNSNSFLNWNWETDLVSVTKSGYIHEYEVKISKADYLQDFKKFKHRYFENIKVNDYLLPTYFWYVTYGFEIEPPSYAGWINIYYGDPYDWGNERWLMEVKKNAPRINNLKITDKHYKIAARLLSWKVYKDYKKHYAYEGPDKKTNGKK